MENFKNKISDLILNYVDIDKEIVEKNVVLIKEKDKGDYTFPCFSLSKILKKAPNIIADEIKEKIKIPDFIEKIENVNGYLNFFIKKEYLIETVFKEFDLKKDKYGESSIGRDKTILIDYSSPNIAKPFHIGHLRTTVIGRAIYNIYKFLGYNVVGINHLGDYGTQFGKLIEAYKLWHDEYNIEENPIEELTKMYVRINELCNNDEKVLENCRNNFKLLEEKDEYSVNLWKKIYEASMIEFNKIYDLLDIKFDSIRGESKYVDDMYEVIDILEKNNKITISDGAKIVDLESDGISTPCIVYKSNDSSIYALRDLEAILYRARTYDYDECIYVTGSEQNLHFKQIFAVAKYLNLKPKYVNGLKHISYGMYRLKEGKMSTRKGNFIKVEELKGEKKSIRKYMFQDSDGNIEDYGLEKYKIDLEYIENKYYNNDKLTRKEKIFLMFKESNREILKKISKGDEIMDKIYKRLDKLSEDEALSLLYDEKEREEAKIKAEIEYAEEHGLNKGISEEKVNIAKKMLNKRIDIKEISEITGLSLEDIKNLG